MRSFLFVISVLILFSCNKEVELVKEVRQLEFFNQIELEDAYHVTLVEDSSSFIEIEAADGRLEKIDLSIIDSVLKIKNLKRSKWLTPTKNEIRLTIHSPQIDGIIASGGNFVTNQGELTSSEFSLVLVGKQNEAKLNLNTDVFFYYNNFPCGGRVTLTGQTNVLKLYNFALMEVHAETLESKVSLIENSSKGRVRVRASEKLDYSIFGDGNIELFGPSDLIIESRREGAGKLVQK